MKLTTFIFEGAISYGAVSNDGVIDLGRRLRAPSLKDLLADGLPLASMMRGLSADYSLRDIQLLPPIPNATHIIGIGLNTKSHFEETLELMSRKPGDYPTHPRLFMRGQLSHVGHGAPILIPTVSNQLDYEGEIAVVIGKPCHNVSSATALNYVAGYSCYNDGSVRDYQLHTNQSTGGKNFFASGSFGPWITTADEIDDLAKLKLETRVNKELRQTLTVDDLIFSFSELIEYISQIYVLQPGDVIATGSPAGIGFLQKKWLRDGDLIEITVSGIGTLVNPVSSAKPASH